MAHVPPRRLTPPPHPSLPSYPPPRSTLSSYPPPPPPPPVPPSAPRAYVQAPSVPALSADIEDESTRDGVARFRRGRTPWIGLSVMGLVAAVLGALALTTSPSDAKRVLAKGASAAASPAPVAAQSLPPPAPAPVPAPAAVPAPPPATTPQTAPLPPVPASSADAAHPYDADRDPAMKYHAPDAWLGPAPKKKKR
jgi:hypothetical protein